MSISLKILLFLVTKFHNLVSLNYFSSWQHCNAKLFNYFNLNSLLWDKKFFWACICGILSLLIAFSWKIETRFLRSATFWPLGRGLSFDSRRLGVVQRDAETQIAPFYSCSINRKLLWLAEKHKKKHVFFKSPLGASSIPPLPLKELKFFPSNLG